MEGSSYSKSYSFDRGLYNEEEFGFGGLNMDNQSLEQGVRDFKKSLARD